LSYSGPETMRLWALGELSPEDRDNLYYVYSAVNAHGDSLSGASVAMRADRRAVFLALNSSRGSAAAWVDPALLEDGGVQSVLRAVAAGRVSFGELERLEDACASRFEAAVGAAAASGGPVPAPPAGGGRFRFTDVAVVLSLWVQAAVTDGFVPDSDAVQGIRAYLDDDGVLVLEDPERMPELVWDSASDSD
jgi:hypothetical protein